MRRGIRTEREHAELVVEDARHRVHQTVDLLSGGVNAPFPNWREGFRKRYIFLEPCGVTRGMR